VVLINFEKPVKVWLFDVLLCKQCPVVNYIKDIMR